jgi:hypothetical protein
MTQFEYLSTFVSILYAIMVGRAVSTLASLTFDTVNWRHFAWIAVLLVNILQTWWIRWSGHDELYHYGWFILSVAHTIPMMFAVATLSPVKHPDNWSTYFEDNRIRFFSSYGTFWIIIGFSNFMGNGNWTGAIGPLLFCIVGATLKNRYVQTVLPVIFLTIFILIGVNMAWSGV